ncbi:MAG TPA: isochorismatase family cysteine hydrolase, partial [Gaiellaceae bacterium]
QGIVARFGEAESALLQPLSDAIATAREAGALVVYVRVAFRAGAPESSVRNRSFAALAGRDDLQDGDEGTQVHPAVAPGAADPVVVKKRVSAFTGSDLEVLLRSREIDTLILTGIATSGVVLSTLREAADRDYRLAVLSDCCLDADAEVHRVLTEKVFPRQADVLTAAELRGRLS